jgi:hypothetical protein
MRLPLLILLFLFGTNSLAQISLLKGTWINLSSELILIHDTIPLDNSNYLENNGKNKDLLLYIYGDTLSFQDQYYSSSDNFEKLIVDRYDFKLLSYTSESIVVRPVSKLSKSFFGKETNMTFTKQSSLINDSIDIEKIIFHTSRCYGNCPTYHLQIDNKRQVKLFAEEVYLGNSEIFAFQEDTSKMGYFQGVINENKYFELINKLRTCNLEKLAFDGTTCCDGSIITMIIYYNGKRKYLKSMFPPIIANSLISCLYNICNTTSLTKTHRRFRIEK